MYVVFLFQQPTLSCHATAIFQVLAFVVCW